jgi:sulfur carrier protein
MMTVTVNAEPRETGAATLEALLGELDLNDAAVATALNGRFVPAAERATTRLEGGDRVEILAPMQGG